MIYGIVRNEHLMDCISDRNAGSPIFDKHLIETLIDFDKAINAYSINGCNIQKIQFTSVLNDTTRNLIFPSMPEYLAT